jgi:uncharacterized protein
MPLYTFTPEDIEPLLEGLAILGTGGGGSPAWGVAIMQNEFAHGRRPQIIPLEEIRDDANVVCGGIMGSVKKLEEFGTEAIMAHWEERFELEAVTHIMEGIIGKKVDHMVPFEVGGLNTPVVLSLGARMGFPIIDGDALGRSAPETQMTSFIGHGISLTPMPLIDYYGNVVIVQDSVNATYPDQLGRWVVTNGGGLGANNHYPMTGKQAKRAVVPHTVSGALKLGRAVLAARASGGDPIDVIARELIAKRLFSGEITRLDEGESLGFYLTLATLQGAEPYRGQTARLAIKNETMLLEVEGRPRAIFPDSVLLLEPKTGRGIMSIELKVGSRLELVGMPAHSRLQEAVASEVGAQAFSPARYGRPELVYRPMRELG